MYAPLNSYDEEGYVAAHYGARDGNVTRLEKALSSDPTLVNVQGIHDGATPLIFASRGVRGLPAVDWLIAQGADVEISDHDGMTALSHAAVAGNLAGVERLLATGADPNTKMASKRWGAGTTPFMAALIVGADAVAEDRRELFLLICDRLVEVGASPNARDVSGRQALTYIALKGKVEILKEAIFRYRIVPEKDAAQIDPHELIRHVQRDGNDVMEILAGLQRAAMLDVAATVMAERDQEQALRAGKSYDKPPKPSRFGL